MAVNRMATYGIGVQNRYSAFLDDEDGFVVVAANAATGAKHHQLSRATAPAMAKQRAVNSAAGGAKQSTTPSSNGTKLANKGVNGRQTNQSPIKGAQFNGEQQQQHKRVDGKHQRANNQQQQQPNQHGANNNVSVQRQTANGKQGNIGNQENTANQRNNRFGRAHNATNSNNHQSSVSQQPNKETNDSSGQLQTGGKFARNNSQRSNRRQPNHEDSRKANSNGQTEEGGNVSSFGVGIGDEEKRRRQQKRALDLKHKDPEKREARRQQQQTNSTSMEQAGEHAEPTNQGDLAGSRGPRGRDGPGEGAARGSRGAGGIGAGRVRRRRNDQGPGVGPKGPGGPERRDGQQQTNQARVPRTGDDRAPRNRNGFGAGSRGSRGGRENNGRGDSDRQKPIPNFSDKQDFPSLAS